MIDATSNGNGHVPSLDQQPGEADAAYVKRVQAFAEAVRLNPGMMARQKAAAAAAGPNPNEHWDKFAARQKEPDWLGGDRATFYVEVGRVGIRGGQYTTRFFSNGAVSRQHVDPDGITYENTDPPEHEAIQLGYMSEWYTKRLQEYELAWTTNFQRASLTEGIDEGTVEAARLGVKEIKKLRRKLKKIEARRPPRMEQPTDLEAKIKEEAKQRDWELKAQMLNLRDELFSQAELDDRADAEQAQRAEDADHNLRRMMEKVKADQTKLLGKAYGRMFPGLKDKMET
jgi:hypothetical protein